MEKKIEKDPNPLNNSKRMLTEVIKAKLKR